MVAGVEAGIRAVTSSMLLLLHAAAGEEKHMIVPLVQWRCMSGATLWELCHSPDHMSAMLLQLGRLPVAVLPSDVSRLNTFGPYRRLSLKTVSGNGCVIHCMMKAAAQLTIL